MKTLLFVYGTLHPEIAPPAMQPLVRQLTRVGEGSMAGALYDLGDFPGAIADSQGTVHGTVYELSDRTLLQKFDEYEGFEKKNPRGSLFLRRRACVQIQGGERVRCWVYLYNQSLGSAAKIDSGVYARPKSV